MCQVRAAGRHHRAPGRQGTAPRPTPRGGGPVSSPALPRIVRSVGSGQCGNARGPRAGPRRRSRDDRDRPRRARSRAVPRGSRVLERPDRAPPPADRVTRGARRAPPRAPRSSAALSKPARSNEVSCRHQKSTSQFQIRMRRRLRATDNSRTATGARRWPAWGRPEGETERLRPVRVRPGTCYIQLHRL